MLFSTIDRIDSSRPPRSSLNATSGGIEDVDTALHEVIAQHGNLSADQAAQYVKGLAKSNRYERDVY